MAEYLLSGYAYFPPIETVITPHVETALLTGNSPRYRRKARSRLGPHHFLVYPPPPPQPPVKVPLEFEFVPAVRAAVLPPRRRPRSRLSPHFFVVYPPPPSGPPVVSTLLVRTVAVTASLSRQRRGPWSVLSPHHFVVYPAPSVVYAPITVHLVRSHTRSRRAQLGIAYPFVVAPGQVLGGTMVVYVQPSRPGLLSSRLSPPVVVNP